MDKKGIYDVFNNKIACIIFLSLSQKKVNTIQGNIPITEHILNVITNVLASVLTLHLLGMQNTMFELKLFI